MKFKDNLPIYLQIAGIFEGQILAGIYSEGEQISSVAEISADYSVNPATANKAVAALQTKGLLEKRRGLGMFVAPGAAGQILKNRSKNFEKDYVAPLLKEAKNLGIGLEDLIKMIENAAAKKEAL